MSAAQAVAEAPARIEERAAIVAFIRKRIDSVEALRNHGRIFEDEASRLKRWLGALADDIDAQLHDDD